MGYKLTFSEILEEDSGSQGRAPIGSSRYVVVRGRRNRVIGHLVEIPDGRWKWSTGLIWSLRHHPYHVSLEGVDTDLLCSTTPEASAELLRELLKTESAGRAAHTRRRNRSRREAVC